MNRKLASDTPNPPGVPQIPRDEWVDHPNFPHQVLLLQSHESFRRISASLLNGVETNRDIQYCAFRFDRWMGFMRGHEHYEEHKLYRYLARRYGASMAPLEAGHVALHADEHEVRRTLQKLMTAAFTDGAIDTRAPIDEAHSTLVKEALAALSTHRDTLREHLDLEERTVIPMLLELPRAEFRVYYQSPIEHLLRQFEPSED